MTSPDGPKDPFANREAEKYSHPIPSREFILDLLRERGSPATRGELLREMGLDSDEDKEALRRRLRAMERDGQLIFTRRGGYALVEKMNLVRGVVSGHKDGYGFLIPDDGSEDLFLNAREMRALFDGDTVLVRPTHKDRRGRYEAELVEILERNTTQLVGRYVVEGNIGFVNPDNKRITQDIIIPSTQEKNAKPGQYVVVEIITPPTYRSQAIGRIIEVLGDHLAPGMEVSVALRSRDLPHKWPAVTLEEAAQFPKEVSEKEIMGRLDLRHKSFVTIDGEDAKDFDDAVYCEPQEKGGWKLYVAIADVSHYVKPHSALDNEALKRGTSVYFPGQVIPMLPEELSNNLCSLRPNRDRLCLICEMTINESGKLMRYVFHEGVIHSKARMTYTNVAAILVKQDAKLRRQYESLLPHLEALYELYRVLKISRKERGAIEFDTIETKVIFGAGRKIEKIIPVERNDAHKLIEECMLMANVAAAQYITKFKIPALYRVHEVPTQEKVVDVRAFLAELGLSLGGGKIPKPADYTNLMQQIDGRPDKHLIQTVLLRSLTQAIYTPENKGHFGLAFKGYTHFTSPIRRYPDLLVHRAIRHLIQQKSAAHYYYEPQQMVKFGEHSSVTERRADDATRDVMAWLKCEYMQDRVGETFPGIITAVVSFGIFVELKDIYVEGLVHVTALPNDYYTFDAKRHRLTGERSNKQFRLADVVEVKVARVDLDARQIDFELSQPESNSKQKVKYSQKISKEKSQEKPKKKRRRRN